MSRKLHLFLFLLLTGGSAFPQEVDFSPTDWEDPAVFEKGQNAPHAFHVPYASKASALENDPSDCENFRLLNGPWKFRWVKTPEQAPAQFWEPEYDVTAWDEITVPANWQMEGYGYPKFRNIQLSFESDPPFIPDYFNPVGCYKRQIQIPASWKDKEVMLRFEGIKSASYLWVNGKQAGYNQGGFEPAEFNITPFIKTGKNDLSVQVLRFCDGSYLENQDMWRLSGIYRDVKIYAQPKTFIHDHYVITDLDENYEDATLIVETDIRNNDTDSKNIRLGVDVLDENGQSVLNESVRSTLLEISGNSSKKIRLSTLVDKPKKWSAEFPNLYTLLIHLEDEHGQPLEAFTQKTGFREVEYKDQLLTFNGVPVKLNGINSHMHHPEKGQAVPPETLRQDLLIMKRFNINCVRTCHYPPTPEYLAMADEIGIYVVDEVGDEAHNNIQLSEDPAWAEMYKDRSRKLVCRDRNHPSVLMWSAGNESGSGPNIRAVIETGKAIDPSRPAWMYGGNTFYIPFEDIVGPRYWIPLWLRNLVKGAVLPEGDHRASFMDEYLAATGNGLGGLNEYWEIIRKYPQSAGGAVWDFVSPGLSTPRWTLPDRSPAKNDGQLMGQPAFVPGKNGRGLEFTGHDDWVEFYRDPSLDITGKQISIGFWVKPYEIPQPNTFLTKGQHQYGIRMEDPQTLEFYIHSGKRVSAKAKVAANFYDNWHHIAGVYDGEKLILYIDEKPAAETTFAGSISSTPFPLCIGREADTQDQGEYAGRLSKMVMDDLCIFDRAVSPAELKSQAEGAVLALDFEGDRKDGSFYAVGLGGRTYGVIWPDRKVQPELHQLKRSGQPVWIELTDPENGTIKVTNYHHFKNLNELAGVWELQIDGKPVQREEFTVDLPAGQSTHIPIPYRPVSQAGEKILTVSFRLKEGAAWADAGHEVAWEQFVLPSDPTAPEDEPGTGKVSATETETEIRLEGINFRYTMDKSNAQLTSLRYEGAEYLESGPEFRVWRAPLANDIDPWGSYKFYSNNLTTGYGRSIDNQLRTLGMRDLRNEVEKIEVVQAAGDKVVVQVKAWSMSSFPATAILQSGNNFSAFERREVWTFRTDGAIELEQELIPHGAMPEMLPKEGLQFLMPKEFRLVEWYGRGPFETYPDRKTGAPVGLYRSDADAMYEPYIFPQDYGNRTDVRWLRVQNREGRGLLISGDQLLNFSLHKYSTDNLSRANYTYQLEEAPHAILNIDYHVSGVGGTAVRQLEAYRLKAARRKHTLTIKPF